MKENSVRRLLATASECAQLEAKPENTPPYQLNLLEIVPTAEPHTSQFLCAILSYTQNGRHIVLESFIDRFLYNAGLNKSRVHHPEIAAEMSHIDVRVLDDDYAIIIENKLMNAPFQRNQLGRYIENTHALGYDYENIFVVLLPQYFNPNLIDDLRPSVWNFPPDGLKSSNAMLHCRHLDQYLCWCDDINRPLDVSETTYCVACKHFLPLFRSRTVIIHSDLPDWLLELNQIIEPEQSSLRSAIYQFADFLKGLFGTRINNNLLMDLQKLIRESFIPQDASTLAQWDILNEKSQELNEILSAMSAMKTKLSKDAVDEWYRELKPEFEGLSREVQKSFGLYIKGVWVGCWSGSNNNDSPYWGFYCENKVTDEQRTMVREILDECCINTSKSSAGFISWCNTRNGAARCRSFYNAAKKLGYF